MSRKMSWLLTIAAAFLFYATPAFSQTQQQQPAEVSKPVTHLVRLKYTNADSVAVALSAFTKYNLAVVVPSDRLNSLTLSGSADTVAAMEAMIRELDVPPPPPPVLANLEITADLILALSEKQSEQPIPARLESVMKQLRTNFSYKSYQLLDEVLLQNRERRPGANNGTVSHSNDPNVIRYQVSYNDSYVKGDKSRSVRLDGLKVRLEVPIISRDQQGAAQVHYSEVGFTTDVEVREGQQVIVGKSGVGNGDAIIAVISVKIVG